MAWYNFSRKRSNQWRHRLNATKQWENAIKSVAHVADLNDVVVADLDDVVVVTDFDVFAADFDADDRDDFFTVKMISALEAIF